MVDDAEQSATLADDHVQHAPPWAPQRGVTPPARGLAHQLTDQMGRLFVVGAHGGSGESVLASLLEHGQATDHRWPKTLSGDTRHAVLVARTSASGLLAAQSALRQWASGVAVGVVLHGLVLNADAPGRLPKELADLAKVVSGGAPRTWNIPWVEAWRRGAPPARNDSRRLARAAADLDLIDLDAREVSYGPAGVHVAARPTS